MKDRDIAGMTRKGEQHAAALLTESDVRNIIANPEGLSQRALAARFGVVKAQIYNIQKRKKWAHLKLVETTLC